MKVTDREQETVENKKIKNGLDALVGILHTFAGLWALSV